MATISAVLYKEINLNLIVSVSCFMPKRRPLYFINHTNNYTLHRMDKQLRQSIHITCMDVVCNISIYNEDHRTVCIRLLLIVLF